MKVKKAKERAEKEDKINKELIRSKHGQMVTYGSEIQFMHKDSNYFLMSMNECSQTQQIGYRVEISNEYNSKMIFSLLPRYKSRRIGDCIQFTDEVFIKNIKINSYLSISTISGDGNPSLNLQQTNPYV